MTAKPYYILFAGVNGAGKSTLGVVLAKIENLSFLDGDLLIQGQQGATLQQLIDKLGPSGFIELEGDALASIDVERTVVATGGSAVYSDRAMEHLRSIGVVVYLEISYDSLVKRLGDLQERGVVLKDGVTMSLRDLFDERRPLYERWAEITVNIDDLDITAAARKVINELHAYEIAE